MSRSSFGRFSPGAREENLVIRVWLASLLLIIGGWVYLFWSGNFPETWRVATSTPPLFIVMALTQLFGGWWWWRNDNFTSPELGIYAAVALFATYAGVALGFLFLTDLHDVEVWNGKADKVEWTERYYTESRDEDGDVDRTYYGPYYTIHTCNGEEVEVEKSEWKSYVNHWGGEDRVTSRRNITADGVAFSGGDGDFTAEIHTITWDRDPGTVVPTSVEHVYANYVKASNSVEKISGMMDGYRDYLLLYPEVHMGRFGEIYLDRVMVAGASVSGEFCREVDALLDTALVTLGPTRECNVLVYVVGTEDQRFFKALQEHWYLGKKNDINVVIGYTAGQIRWCRVMAWTNNSLFRERLEGKVRDLGTLDGNGAALCETIVAQITAPAQDGYVRKSMTEYAYLASEVRMPWWAYLLVVIGACVVMMPTVWLVIQD